ncbi:acetylglutamate kinase [Fulvivirga sp. 29W222]|uniref:Acetylglutamate kinase n=1 Tax=Fulvivirga marina TaxID=2494733 RepID=A0A937FXN5_9BACT|nr:acetylglutamate kinase [Fulvivirga marina]MBL6448060.1 acetylglutamate kinase [Fulvivirga marina]
MKTKLTVVKIGGNVIDDAETLKHVLQEFSQLDSPKVLIHGGGKIASELSLKMGLQPKMVDGRRITDADTLKVVTMTYGGLVNKNIVAQLQAFRCNAIGLTGADANVIPAQKRVTKEIDYGYVGDFEVDNIDVERLSFFIDGGLTPIFCALTHDQQGNLLNTNADTLASGIATTLAKFYETKLIYCFEKPGVLLDADDDNTLIRELGYLHYQQLKDDGIIHTGMIPKLDNAFAARRHGIEVGIKHALDLNKPAGTILL